MRLADGYPVVIVVFGLPGSGKSFFASRLAARHGAVYLSSDRLRMEMYPIRTYTEDEKRAVYDALLDRVLEAVSEKQDVVADGTFYTNDIRERFSAAVKKSATVFLIEVRAAEPLIRERLKRPRAYSEADIDVYNKIKGQWEPPGEDHLVLESAGDNIDEMLSRTADYIKTAHDGTRHT